MLFVWGIIFTSKALLDTSFIVRETPLIDIEPLEVINFFRLKGISIFNINQGKFENFKFNQRSSRNIFPNGFSAILISKKDELWISNVTSGLYKYNPETLDLVKHYIFDIDDKMINDALKIVKESGKPKTNVYKNVDEDF